jgi:hypothetical protein
MTQPQQKNVVSLLKQLRGKPVPNHPTGLPSPRSNDNDVTTDGVYRDEGLTDPGIIGGVTGTGNGPIIGVG